MTPEPDEIAARFTPEFRLVLACLHQPQEESQIAAINVAAEAIQDWPRVFAVALRHRVVGLVARALAQSKVNIPTATAERLRQQAGLQTRQAMLLTAESVRIARMLRESGIEPLFLKGATVTMLAYRDLGLRHAKDVDFLVPETQVWQSAEVLSKAGYVPLLDIDQASLERRDLWRQHAKSMDWIHTGNGALLELHWRPTDLPMLDGRSGADTRQAVTILPGTDLFTLGQDQLLVYLCAHGAAHGWSRLKWLSDVAALMPWDDPQTLHDLYRKADAAGTGRAVGQALLLCHALLQAPIDHALLEELQRDRMLRVLHRWTLRLLARGDEVTEIYDQPFGTSSIYVSRFLLGNSSESLLAEMRTWAFPPDMVLVSRLPQRFFFLFPAIRVGSWITQRLKHGGRSAA